MIQVPGSLSDCPGLLYAARKRAGNPKQPPRTYDGDYVRRRKTMDFRAVFKLKQAWETFTRNHPKVPPFISGIQSKGAAEGMEIAVAVRYPDGTEFKTGVRLTASDMDALRELGAIDPSDLQ